MLLYVRSARLHLLTHQYSENLIGEDGVIHVYLKERALLRIHRRLPELIGVHLSQTLKALDLRVRPPLFLLDLPQLPVAVGITGLFAVYRLVKRRVGGGDR